MTDEKMPDDLGIQMLVDAADRSAHQSAGLREEVGALDRKLDLSNRVLRRLAVLLVVLLLALGLNGLIAYNSNATARSAKDTTATLNDCLNPTGTCAKYAAQVSAINRRIIVLETEQYRLSNVIVSLRAQKNFEGVAANIEQKAAVDQEIMKAKAALEDVNRARLRAIEKDK